MEEIIILVFTIKPCTVIVMDIRDIDQEGGEGGLYQLKPKNNHTLTWCFKGLGGNCAIVWKIRGHSGRQVVGKSGGIILQRGLKRGRSKGDLDISWQLDFYTKKGSFREPGRTSLYGFSTVPSTAIFSLLTSQLLCLIYIQRRW